LTGAVWLLLLQAAMEELVDAGLCKAIGLSNFNSVQIAEIMEKSRIKPSVLQVESHPFFQQEPVLVAFRTLSCGYFPFCVTPEFVDCPVFFFEKVAFCTLSCGYSPPLCYS
jgi:hypothetical protein